MNRNLIIDGQIFQTPAWHRGMGKYSMELVSALYQNNLKNNHWEKIELIVSSNLEIEATFIEQLNKIAHSVNVVYLDLKSNSTEQNAPLLHNQKVIQEYLQSASSTGVDYLILSLLQSEIIPPFPLLANVRRILLLYDLIPLMFYDTYLGDAVNRQLYLSKIKLLLEADIYLTISKTVANDLAAELAIDSSRIYNIDGGPIEHSKKTKKIPVDEPFILMPTGNDLRKNNARGILAFKKFNEAIGAIYSLVITSSFKDFEIDELSSLSPNVIFTGNVSGEELNYLYEKSSALFFPTEYEGLGLPILEAMEKDKPIACSDIPVFRELSTEAFYYFDPKNIDSMAGALGSSIKKGKPQREIYKTTLSKYSWRNTADQTVKAMQQKVPSMDRDETLSVAFVGPDPSAGTYGEIMQKSYSELSRLFPADFFLNYVNEPVIKLNYLPYIAKTGDLKSDSVSKLRNYDRLIYHIDSSQINTNVLFTALANPGILILHSTELGNLWENMVADRLVDESRYELEKMLDIQFGGNDKKYLVSLIASHNTIIVDNDEDYEQVKTVAKKINSTTKVVKMEQPIPNPVYPELVKRKDRKAIGESFKDYAAKIYQIAIDQKTTRGDDV